MKTSTQCLLAMTACLLVAVLDLYLGYPTYSLFKTANIGILAALAGFNFCSWRLNLAMNK